MRWRFQLFGKPFRSSLAPFQLQGKIIVECDSPNAMSWVSPPNAGLWIFHVYVIETKLSASSIIVAFRNVSRLANGLADVLANQGVSRVTTSYALTM